MRNAHFADNLGKNDRFQEHVLNYVHNSQYFGIIRMYRKRDIMQLIIYHMYRAKVNSLLQLKNQFPVDVFNSFVARLRQENPHNTLDGHHRMVMI